MIKFLWDLNMATAQSSLDSQIQIISMLWLNTYELRTLWINIYIPCKSATLRLRPSDIWIFSIIIASELLYFLVVSWPDGCCFATTTTIAQERTSERFMTGSRCRRSQQPEVFSSSRKCTQVWSRRRIGLLVNGSKNFNSPSNFLGISTSQYLSRSRVSEYLSITISLALCWERREGFLGWKSFEVSISHKMSWLGRWNFYFFTLLGELPHTICRWSDERSLRIGCSFPTERAKWDQIDAIKNLLFAKLFVKSRSMVPNSRGWRASVSLNESKIDEKREKKKLNGKLRLSIICQMKIGSSAAFLHSIFEICSNRSHFLVI